MDAAFLSFLETLQAHGHPPDSAAAHRDGLEEGTAHSYQGGTIRFLQLLILSWVHIRVYDDYGMGFSYGFRQSCD